MIKYKMHTGKHMNGYDHDEVCMPIKYKWGKHWTSIDARASFVKSMGKGVEKALTVKPWRLRLKLGSNFHEGKGMHVAL